MVNDDGMTWFPIAGKLALAPGHVTVVGGGRWARVILDVLCELLPLGVRLDVYTRAREAMTEWRAGHPRRQRISVASVFSPEPGDVVIVANAARDHVAAAAAALRAGSFVLVEKPLAPDFDSARAMVDLAAANGARLAAAQVTLFARYVDNFAAQVGRIGRLELVECNWTDIEGETRYGEVKSFDPGVPVFCDWLPHVAPMLEKILPVPPDSARLLGFEHGGAAVDLSLDGGGVPCAVHFARNSDRRRRIIRVRGAGGMVELDSSLEPGTITAEGRVHDADPLWGSRPKPLAQLLTAFLAWSTGGSGDARLDPGPGLRSCRLVGQIDASYRPQVEKWLGARLEAGAPVDPASHYALREILRRQDSRLCKEVGAEAFALACAGGARPGPEALTGHPAAAQFPRALASANLPG